MPKSVHLRAPTVLGALVALVAASALGVMTASVTRMRGVEVRVEQAERSPYLPITAPLPEWKGDHGEALRRLDSLLRAQDRELFDSLAPPASDHDLERLRAELGALFVSEEILALYAWHNGQRSMELPFLPGRRRIIGGMETSRRYDPSGPFFFLTVEQALHARDLLGPVPVLPVFMGPNSWLVSSLSLSRHTATAPVFLLTSGMDEMYLHTHHVTGFIDYVAECILNGRIDHEDGRRVLDPSDDLRYKWNREAFFWERPSYLWPRRLSVPVTHLWPLDWKRWIGRSPEDYAIPARSRRVAELARLRPGEQTTTYAEVVGMARYRGGSRLTISDGPGQAVVILRNDFLRDIEVGAVFALTIVARLAPIDEGDEPTRLEVLRVVRMSAEFAPPPSLDN